MPQGMPTFLKLSRQPEELRTGLGNPAPGFRFLIRGNAIYQAFVSSVPG